MDSPSPYSAVADFEQRYVRPKAGPALIVGSCVYPGRIDRRPMHKNAVGWDMISGPGVDRVVNLEETLPEGLGKFSHVECMSVLEHSRKPWKLAKNLERLLEPGGTIYLTVPFVWRLHSYPEDYWRFTISAVRMIFPLIEWSKLLYANSGLTDSPKTLGMKVNEFPYFARSEVCGFGALE